MMGRSKVTELEVQQSWRGSWEWESKGPGRCPCLHGSRLPHPVPHVTGGDQSLERSSPSAKTRGCSWERDTSRSEANPAPLTFVCCWSEDALSSCTGAAALGLQRLLHHSCAPPDPYRVVISEESCAKRGIRTRLPISLGDILIV